MSNSPEATPPAEPRAPRARRAGGRSVRQSLLSVVLGFELIIVFLTGLTVFGLKALPEPMPPYYALIGGAVVCLMTILAIPLLNRPAGHILGWAVQLIMVAAGFLVGEIYLVAAMFLALWIFANYQGAKIDDRNAAFLAQAEAGETPTTPTH